MRLSLRKVLRTLGIKVAARAGRTFSDYQTGKIVGEVHSKKLELFV